MKRILFITAFVPSRIGAGENFSRRLINDLAVQNYIDLICFKYSYNEDYIIESNNVKVLKTFSNSLIIKLLNYMMFPFIFPLFVVRFNLNRLFFIKKAVRKYHYDLLIFDFSQTFLFSKFIHGIPKVFYSQDVIAQRYSRIYWGIFVPFVRLSEKFVLNSDNVKIFTPSEKDSKIIIQLYSIETTVTDIYLDQYVMNSIPDVNGNYFVLFANWNRPDNSYGLKWFLKYVYPELNKELNFKIIGTGLPNNGNGVYNKGVYPNLEYLGFVDNPYPVISNARALISPLFTGAGVKVKVIESLACGTSVIGTDLSFEGISDKYSSFMKVARSREDFVSVINNFQTELSEKLELKKLFINTYNNKGISGYINSRQFPGRYEKN